MASNWTTLISKQKSGTAKRDSVYDPFAQLPPWLLFTPCANETTATPKVALLKPRPVVAPRGHSSEAEEFLTTGHAGRRQK